MTVVKRLCVAALLSLSVATICKETVSPALVA